MQDAYRFDAIAHLLLEACLREAAIQEFFTEGGIVPLTIVYEDFIADYAGTVQRVLDFLGVFPICIKLSCLTHNHGFRPQARPPYNTRILQSTGDSFGAFFFVCRATWGGLARGRYTEHPTCQHGWLWQSGLCV